MPAVFYGGHFSCCCGGGGTAGELTLCERAAGDVQQPGRILAGPGAAPLRLRLRRIHLPLQGRHLKPPLERLPCKGSWRQGRLRGALPLCIRGIFQNQAESCPASPRDAACIVLRGLGDANPAGGNKRRPAPCIAGRSFASAGKVCGGKTLRFCTSASCRTLHPGAAARRQGANFPAAQ